MPIEEKGPSLSMSPMLDVAFLLLIFFVISASQRPIEADISLALPCMHHHRANISVCPMAIRIQADGSILSDGRTLDTDITRRDLPLLEDKLKQYKSAADLLSTEPYILIYANDDAQWQRSMDVLNSLAKVGIRNIGIAGN
ncbi:MAG: biopolymer transporter ExbD [Verrucomicrobia bacterium]|nr:biopolymer transporter ExbD [Verrucomicrobiota bacterium]